MKKLLISLFLLILIIPAFAQINPELLKKAKAGDAEAQYTIGAMYYRGDGVEQNYKKAFEWYDLAAKQGNANAQFNLAYLYFEGDVVSQDYTKAFELYEKAAKQGHKDSYFNLGLMYENGFGVAQDYSKAFEWYDLAAKQGNAIAQYNLAYLYYSAPRGVVKNREKAIELYERAAKQGYKPAARNLGIIHRTGEVTGVPDIVTGCAWIYISGDTNNSIFCDHNLSQAQMTRALYLVDQLKRQIKY